MQPIDILIFSKDRACQLELCIRSIMDKLLIPKKIHIQYTASNNIFGDGYIKLMNNAPDVTFLYEKDFKKDLIKNFGLLKNKYCMFMTDDDVFINNVTFEQLNKTICLMETNDKIHSLSLRMNPTIDYCYPAKKTIDPPAFIYKGSDYLLWDWTQSDQFCCWGYPMAVNAHIYDGYYIKELIAKGDYNNVNSLESYLDCHRFDKSLLLSFPETKIFNVQNNFVQGINMDSNYKNYSVQFLNELYLQNYIINSSNIYGIQPKAVHGVIDYKFIKVDKKNKYDEVTEFLKSNPGIVFNDDQRKRDKKHIIYLLESFNIKSSNYDWGLLKDYKAIITWNKKIHDTRKDKFNIYLINGFTLFNMDHFGYMDSYESYDHKINGVSLICKYRDSVIDFDISKNRLDVLLQINKTKKIITDYYGTTPYPNIHYKGPIGNFGTNETFPSSIEKLKILNKYKFNLCFENCYHELWSWDYITEKIFDCFRAKTIPIYWGCYNIEDHIPKDLFIDFRDFKSNIPKLVEYLLSISKEEYNERTERAFRFEQTCQYGKVEHLQNLLLEIDQ